MKLPLDPSMDPRNVQLIQRELRGKNEHKTKRGGEEEDYENSTRRLRLLIVVFSPFGSSYSWISLWMRRMMMTMMLCAAPADADAMMLYVLLSLTQRSEKGVLESTEDAAGERKRGREGETTQENGC